MQFRLDGVRSGYGAMDILHGVDLCVAAAETLAILGPNGAGKSVLLKTMAGLLGARSGRIEFANEDVTALNAAERARRGLALLPQTDLVFPAMSVQENLKMGAYVEPNAAKRRHALERTYERYPLVAAYRHKAANALSGGQQKMVGLARAMMLEPKALLLDEPSIGLDPKSLAFFAQELDALNKKGITLILVEQNVKFALAVVRRVCFIRLGRIERDAPSAQLVSSQDLLSLYFGGDAADFHPN
jgi:ABC-type branched-subunit amino acid transport system ATPase component